MSTNTASSSLATLFAPICSAAVITFDSAAAAFVFETLVNLAIPAFIPLLVIIVCYLVLASSTSTSSASVSKAATVSIAASTATSSELQLYVAPVRFRRILPVDIINNHRPETASKPLSPLKLESPAASEDQARCATATEDQLDKASVLCNQDRTDNSDAIPINDIQGPDLGPECLSSLKPEVLDGSAPPESLLVANDQAANDLEPTPPILKLLSYYLRWDIPEEELKHLMNCAYITTRDYFLRNLPKPNVEAAPSNRPYWKTGRPIESAVEICAKQVEPSKQEQDHEQLLPEPSNAHPVQASEHLELALPPEKTIENSEQDSIHYKYFDAQYNNDPFQETDIDPEDLLINYSPSMMDIGLNSVVVDYYDHHNNLDTNINVEAALFQHKIFKNKKKFMLITQIDENDDVALSRIFEMKPPKKQPIQPTQLINRRGSFALNFQVNRPFNYDQFNPILRNYIKNQNY